MYIYIYIYIYKGIPYGQALRMKRIWSMKETYNRRIELLRGNYEKRGFSKRFVDSQFNKAKGISWNSLLCQEERKEKNWDITSLVMTFHPALSGVGKVVDSLWLILLASDGTAKIFNEKPEKVYRRPRNLRDSLVRARVRMGNIRDKGMRKCGKSLRQIWGKIVLGEEGSCFGDCRGHMYYINFSFDCDSTGVIYLLTCDRCSKIYVGSTVTSFRKRFNNHKSSLKRFGKGQRGIASEHLYAHKGIRT